MSYLSASFEKQLAAERSRTVPMESLTSDVKQPDGLLHRRGCWFVLAPMEADLAELDGTARRVGEDDHQAPSGQQFASYQRPYR